MSTPTALNNELLKHRKTYWTNAFKQLERKSVLLVEGEDDLTLVEAVFSSKRKTWSNHIAVLDAGGREMVLSILHNKRLPECPEFQNLVLGLVDRDTWDYQMVTNQRNTLPNLYVTEGWCAENTFFEQQVLQESFGSNYSAVQTVLDQARENWVRAGVW